MNVRRVILASVCALLCGCTSPTPPRSASAVLYIISGQTYIFVRPDASVGTRVNYVQHEWYFPDLNVALVTGSQGPNTHPAGTIYPRTADSYVGTEALPRFDGTDTRHVQEQGEIELSGEEMQRILQYKALLEKTSQERAAIFVRLNSEAEKFGRPKAPQ